LSSIFYSKAGKRLYHVLYALDAAVRAPIFANPPEPAPGVLVRPLSTYSVYLGVTEYGTPYYWDPELLQNPMIAVIGMPGAGKSELVKTLIMRFRKKARAWGLEGVPVFVVDPEGEYGAIARQLGEGVVLDLGRKDYVNIFDRPSKEVNYQYWARAAVIPGILSAIKATPAQAPVMHSVLEDTVFKVYEEVYRFSPVDRSTWSRDDPTLLDVVKQLEQVVEPVREGRKRPPPHYNTYLSLYERLKRWVYGEGSDFFAHRSTVKLSELMEQPLVVFNIKYLPQDARDAFTYYIFNYFYWIMKNSQPCTRFCVRILLVFDEGWILLKKREGEEAPIAQLFREARKYGFAAMIATQQYKDVSEDILPLVGTVVILRIRDNEAVEKLAKTLKIPDRIATAIPSLPTGRAVFAPAWRSTAFQNSASPFVVKIESEVEPMYTGVFYEVEAPEEVFKALRSSAAG